MFMRSINDLIGAILIINLMLEVSQKLLEFHSSIRRAQINSLMNKLRYEVSLSIE